MGNAVHDRLPDGTLGQAAHLTHSQPGADMSNRVVRLHHREDFVELLND
jgi:hypothetical protein